MTGELRALGPGGDTKVVWSSGNADEVANARRTFDELRKKGFSAFDVGALGKKGDRITEFDPEAEKIIMTPALRGG